ncbi:metalloregulator ArsR/SmtB family transcription factor [Streptomyces sp. NBC_01298]|uniref:ArsR/SmtB family transcription factor n=1 Tax=Streptomyces sp. NBC_01298 TaxID=2903817 RepID=UPI002E11E88B|nr:metalloregulator ArsR/SmtB family transcription factor [Streptomyces sp. NBC_01298]
MNETTKPGQGLSPEDAQTYSGWFRALADPMRVRLLNLLAEERRPLTVGEITERLPIGQSTVSHHLKLLAEVRFVLPERRGTSVSYEVNDACLECFPAAVSAILGRRP